MRIIYLDTLFVLNMAADLLCITATERVCDRRCGRCRRLAASMFGGGYAVMSVLPKFTFLQSPLLFPVCAMAMTVIAFGSGELLKPFFSILAAGGMLGGAVYCVSLMLGTNALFSSKGTLRVFLISMGISWSVFTAAFKRMGRKTRADGILDAEMCYRKRKVRFRALRDTGNSLRDPVTGRRVLVCELRTVLPLFDEEERRLLAAFAADPVKLLEAEAAVNCRSNFRIIPYRAVGVSGGMLAAFTPDILRYNGKEVKRPLAAIAPGPVSDGGAYSALAGGEDV